MAGLRSVSALSKGTQEPIAAGKVKNKRVHVMGDVLPTPSKNDPRAECCFPSNTDPRQGLRFLWQLLAYPLHANG